MLSGNNGILQRASNAKTDTDNAQIKEKIQLAELAARTVENGKLTEANLNAQLKSEFGANGYTLDTTSSPWVITVGSVTYETTGSSSVTTIGDAYDDSWIGKTIEYEAGPEGDFVNDWIILGQESDGDIIITTKNSISSFELSQTLEGWCNYIDDLNSVCSVYEGTIGEKNIAVKEARSITIDDINNAVGLTIPETFGDVNSDYYYPEKVNGAWKWVKSDSPSYKNNGYGYSEYNGKLYYSSDTLNAYEITSSKATNMKYIYANNDYYIVASRDVHVTPNQIWFGIFSV